MTNKEAKELSIEVWQYIADNPQCSSKEETPYWDQLEELNYNCPLCAVLDDCKSCPISGDHCSLYKQWCNGSKDAAKEILRRIKEWRV